MGACCGGGKDDETPAGPNAQFAKGGPKDISAGPMKNRGCTDIVCLIIYAAFWGVFVFVTCLGFADGNPAKLYMPRDFKGDYCGIDKAGQWNEGQVQGSDLKAQIQRTYTMNVSSTVELVAKQLVCSTVAEADLKVLLTSSQLATYRCACCKDACMGCAGSLAMDDLSSASAVSSTISGKMGELTGASSVGNLFSSGSMNGDFVNNMWKEATKYFNAVCLESCSTPYQNVTSFNRTYRYSPSFDLAWKKAWDVLSTNSNVGAEIRNTVNTKFTFNALPTSKCPYEARYCVPFPGVSFKELASNYCAFEMAAEAVAAVGGAVTDAYNQLGANALVDSVGNSFGSAVGDFMNTLDAFTVVCFLAVVIGLVFLVALRFIVGPIVWLSIGGVLFVFLASGAFVYVRSSQCNGAGLFDSGKNMGSAAVVATTSAVASEVNGGGMSEALTGNGQDYRGAQKMTRSGKTCQNWNLLSPHNHTSTPTNFPNASLTENYCRNPESAPTIWCFTTDPDVRWELCSAIGVLSPTCPEGYVVNSETFRTILVYIAYVLWGCAGVWFLLVLCLCRQIRLAIGINKVAAQFVYNTPSIILVPLLQILVGIAWFFIWALCASFLLSQVPTTYTPTGAFESYAIAYGTADVPGKCTDKPTAGFPWKYEGNLLSTNDPCSGNLGDTTDITPRCWKCAPPRYAFDVGFGVSLFSYLWNAAFLIAVGQCTIAGAVGVWFFAMHTEKTKTKAVRTGLRNCFRYHLGSLALGSFILAVVQFIRYWLMYLEKQASAQKNRAMVCLLKVLQYCVWCIEKCVKFLNKNAYIQIALLGTNFCTSAKNAALLVARNFARFGVVATLGSIIHVLGIVTITASSVGLGYFILMALHPEVTPVVPLMAYLAIGYLVAVLYMNVFGLAVDTVLQCFIATEEMKVNKEEFVPKPLIGFMKAFDDDAKKTEDKEAWG